VRGDVNNMWRETDQEGLWYMAGSFAQCRTYSRYLAQQLKVSLDAQH
jgi:putative flavoprotein involved in K+ transport